MYIVQEGAEGYEKKNEVACQSQRFYSVDVPVAYLLFRLSFRPGIARNLDQCVLERERRQGRQRSDLVEGQAMQARERHAARIPPTSGGVASRCKIF